MRVIGLQSEVKTSPEILKEFFKDHWFGILNNKEKISNFENIR